MWKASMNISWVLLMKYGDFWSDFTKPILTLNLLPPDIKYAYSMVFSMHLLWYWRICIYSGAEEYAQKSASS